jgi:hypothetical protein
MTVKPIAEFVNRGRFYGYPECCIDFFSTVWDGLRKLNTDESDRVMEAYYARVQAAGYEGKYIPCPDCLRKVEQGETPALPRGQLRQLSWPWASSSPRYELESWFA